MSHSSRRRHCSWKKTSQQKNQTLPADVKVAAKLSNESLYTEVEHRFPSEEQVDMGSVILNDMVFRIRLARFTVRTRATLMHSAPCLFVPVVWASRIVSLCLLLGVY